MRMCDYGYARVRYVYCRTAYRRAAIAMPPPAMRLSSAALRRTTALSSHLRPMYSGGRALAVRVSPHPSDPPRCMRADCRVGPRGGVRGLGGGGAPGRRARRQAGSRQPSPAAEGPHRPGWSGQASSSSSRPRSSSSTSSTTRTVRRGCCCCCCCCCCCWRRWRWRWRRRW